MYEGQILTVWCPCSSAFHTPPSYCICQHAAKNSNSPLDSCFPFLREPMVCNISVELVTVSRCLSLMIRVYLRGRRHLSLVASSTSRHRDLLRDSALWCKLFSWPGVRSAACLRPLSIFIDLLYWYSAGCVRCPNAHKCPQYWCL